jgi:DNA-binding IscR family transcriptional regulator
MFQATRGQGGGYQSVASTRNLSVWDVVECFNPPTKSSHNVHSSPEWRSTNRLTEEVFQYEKEFLQKFPISQLVSNLFDSDALKQTQSMTKGIQPLPQKVKSGTPNSVFDLANFLNL